MHPTRIDAMMASALAAVANSAADAGGPTKPLNYSALHFSHVGLTIQVENLTVRDSDPESAGGQFRFEELRAVFQGVRANLRRLDNEESKIDIWRVGTGGFPRRERRVKHLGFGTVGVTPDALESGLASESVKQTK
ncbi:MAG: hypothetical protein Q9209_007439 [Squamulea sp. 1 TL-2023]